MKIKIDNYENMTPEEKLAALEAYDPESDGYVSKSVLDKKASEAAELSKKLKERMTEEEAKAAKDADERAALMARVEELCEKFPGLDMISFGPTLRGVHAPGERLDLASLDKFVALLVDLVTNYK